MYVSVQGIPFHSRLLSVAFNTVSWLALAHFSPKVFLLSFGFIFVCYSFNRKQNVIAQLFLVLLADCFFFLLGCVVFFFLSSRLLLCSCSVCNSQSVFLLLIFIKWKITELGEMRMKEYVEMKYRRRGHCIVALYPSSLYSRFLLL